MTDFASLAADVHAIREALEAAPTPPVPPATLPPIAFNGTHWSNGAYTNPGQLGDADGTRLKMWRDDFAGTQAEVVRLQSAGVPVLLGGDLNTPAKNLPMFVPDQVFLYNTAGLDKLIYIPATWAIPRTYDAKFGKVRVIDTPSDHPLLVVPVTLLLDGSEVLTFRFGTCNVKHTMSADDKRATMQAALAACDVVVWQETDTDAANSLIDEVFPPAEWHHMFDDFETDMSIRKSMFDLTKPDQLPSSLTSNQGKPRISDGVAHVSPNRYDVWAVCTPIPQPKPSALQRFGAFLRRLVS